MKTLVAGFGNILLHDDGFGVEVVRELQSRTLPAGVELLDVGIGGFGFVLAMLERFDRAVIVDTVRHGKPAGTLHVFRPSEADLRLETRGANPHLFEPATAMSLARRLHALPSEIIVVGCEPSSCEFGLGLTPVVAEAVPAAVRAVLRVIGEVSGAP